MKTIISSQNQNVIGLASFKKFISLENLCICFVCVNILVLNLLFLRVLYAIDSSLQLESRQQPR